MISVYRVTYWESPYADTRSNKYFGNYSDISANKFAKSVSKRVGRTAEVYLVKGDYIEGEFY